MSELLPPRTPADRAAEPYTPTARGAPELADDEAPAPPYAPGPAAASDAAPSHTAPSHTAPSHTAPSHTAPSHAATPGDALPGDTTPTYELELLVSGAVLVGLFQIPPALTALTDGWVVDYGMAGIIGSMLVGVALRAALYALMGCFVLHLALRGYWAAMVGVNSMFPAGVRWERMRESGPIARAIGREGMRPLPETIARLDNAASLVFATGFILAASGLGGLTTMLAVGALTVVVAAAGVPHAEWAFLGIMVVLLVLLSAASMVDLRLGDRLQGWPARAVRAYLRLHVRAQPASVAALASTVRTNIDGRVAYGVGGAVLVGAMSVAMWTELSRVGLGAGAPSGYRYYAEDSETRAVQADFYDNLRAGPPANPRAPSLQSDVITEPYARLFIPYIPIRHNDALRRACPDLAARAGLDAERDDPAYGTAADRILACARAVHRPALDGRALDATPIRFFTDPRTGRRGFRLLVPVAGLPAGEHVVTLWPATANGRPPARAPYTIPFWR